AVELLLRNVDEFWERPSKRDPQQTHHGTGLLDRERRPDFEVRRRQGQRGREVRQQGGQVHQARACPLESAFTLAHSTTGGSDSSSRTTARYSRRICSRSPLIDSRFPACPVASAFPRPSARRVARIVPAPDLNACAALSIAFALPSFTACSRAAKRAGASCT